MKKILVTIIILATQLLSSQEINSRKGQFFLSGGLNRSFYTDSDISFTGKRFNFTLENVKSDDRHYLDPNGLSFSQANFKIGYFFKDNYNIVLGYDNMRYVMRNGQNVRIQGKIATDSYLYNGVKYNFDDVYNYEEIYLSDSFLLYEHNGLNYFFAGVNRFDNFNKLLGINTDKFEVNLEEGIDFGFVMPKTNTTILGNEKYENSNIVGFGLSVSAGINLTFFKYFFVKAAIKYGYIDIKDSRVTISDASAKVEQHFDFIQPSYTFGLRFQVFPVKKEKEYVKKEKELEKNTSSLDEVKTDILEPENIKEDSPTDSPADSPTDTEIDTEIDTSIDMATSTAKTSFDPNDCSEKALEYKEKSNTSVNKSAQKAYSWLSLYYRYRCECENGSKRSNQLVILVNNIVDSYYENTDGSYGEIIKVSKCKPLTKDN